MPTRPRGGVILVAALTTTVLGLGSVGCGRGSSSTGGVLLTVAVPTDVQIESVDYELDDMVAAPVAGTLAAPYPVRDFVKFIGTLPPSDTYVATAHAISVDGLSECTASAPVRVMKNLTTRVEAALACHVIGGHVIIGIGVTCHETPLVEFLVSPVVTTVGSYVLGRASSSPDAGALTYAWSAPSGTFSDAEAAQTTFTCAKTGPVEVTLQIQDDAECKQTYTAMVTCLPAPEGGVTDAGDGGDATSDDSSDDADAGASD